MTKPGQFFSNAIKLLDYTPLRKMQSSHKTFLRKDGLTVPMAIPLSVKELITRDNAHNFIVAAFAYPLPREERLVANILIPTKNKVIRFTPGLTKAWESSGRFTIWTNVSKIFTVNVLWLNKFTVWQKESGIALNKILIQLAKMKLRFKRSLVPFASIMMKLSKNVVAESKVRCC